MPRRGRPFVIEPDRRAAIALALGEARAGDVVVIAGKGHETGQEVRGPMVPFDDRAVARRRSRRGWGRDEAASPSGGGRCGRREPVDADGAGSGSVAIDSRLVGAGALFVALAGEHEDGHAFVGDAFDARRDGGARSAAVSW